MNTNNDNEKYVLPLITNDVKEVKNADVFKRIIGQAEVRKKLAFYVNSYSEQTPIPNFLFTGSAGLGKSFMAGKVAEATGRELVEVNCGTIETSKDFIEGILLEKVAGETPKTLLLDEAHKLSGDVTTSLLTLLNPTVKNKNQLSYKHWIVEYDFAKINTILATTDAHCVFKPLVNRCIEVYFHLYSNKELFAILSHYLEGINITCDKEEAAWACRGRARDAYILSQNIKRYCIMKDTNVFDTRGWEAIRDIFGIYSYGLNKQEVGFMRVLAESSPISCNNIAVMLGVNAQNVEEEIEVRPRELGFVESGTRGRMITEEGKNYLRRIR